MTKLEKKKSSTGRSCGSYSNVGPSYQLVLAVLTGESLGKSGWLIDHGISRSEVDSPINSYLICMSRKVLGLGQVNKSVTRITKTESQNHSISSKI